MLRAQFRYAKDNCYLRAALGLIKPLLKSPITQIMLSFVLGYYVTTKISRLCTLGRRTDSDSGVVELLKTKKLYTDNDHDDDGKEDDDDGDEQEDPMSLRLTRRQLMSFNGMCKSQPIYTALNGNIYDISSSRDASFKLGPYSLLAGCNANQVLNIACGSMGVPIDDYVQRFERSLNAEFNIIGQLVDSDDSDSEEPSIADFFD